MSSPVQKSKPTAAEHADASPVISVRQEQFMMNVWSHRPKLLHLGFFIAAYVLACGFAQSLAIVPGTGISIWPASGLFLVDPYSQLRLQLALVGIGRLPCGDVQQCPVVSQFAACRL
ncbi:putative two-component sensor histidine kinase, partial [Rhizobium sp. Pop5]